MLVASTCRILSAPALSPQGKVLSQQSSSVPHQLVYQAHPSPSLCLFWLPYLEIILPLPPHSGLRVAPQSGSVGLSHCSHYSACLSAPGATPHVPLSPPWPCCPEHRWRPGCLHSRPICGQALGSQGFPGAQHQLLPARLTQVPFCQALLLPCLTSSDLPQTIWRN